MQKSGRSLNVGAGNEASKYFSTISVDKPVQKLQATLLSEPFERKLLSCILFVHIKYALTNSQLYNVTMTRGTFVNFRDQLMKNVDGKVPQFTAQALNSFTKIK
jgi:hypothetical protein